MVYKRFCAFLFVVGFSQHALAWWDNDTDRPGGDYGSFSVDSPGECQQICESEGRCRAWTYVSPGVLREHGPKAVCALKEVVPNPVPKSCCKSGVKGK